MTELLLFFGGLILGLFIVVLWHFSKISRVQKDATNWEQQFKAMEEKMLFQKNTFAQQWQNVQDELSQLRSEKEDLLIHLSKKEADFDHLWENSKKQKEEFAAMQEKMAKDFEWMANKILDEKSEKFTNINHQNIKGLLLPLQEKIVAFEQKVEQTHRQSIDQHASLREHIQMLTDINNKMSQETINLTNALKGDNKIQGNWGELILEKVLEKSGLEKDREYFVQTVHDTEDGRKIPDVIIHLPDNKKMIVDSKVSLKSYEAWVSEMDTNSKEQFANQHLTSIKRHIEQLSAKNYQSLYQTQMPDFVLMFVPIEPAFALALQMDNQLYHRAFDKNIVIVTPTTLLATLRTIDSMWNNQKQQNNAIEIAKKAGSMYDKFYGFVTDMLLIGKKIDDSKNAYQDAWNKLSDGKGNLLTSAEKLKALGAKAQKSLSDLQPKIDKNSNTE